MSGMRNRIFAGTAALAIGAGFARAGEAKGEALFDGKSLAGWSSFLVKPGVKTEDVWSVKDGILVCRGEPMGYLHTTRAFTNFRLTVEWRWAPEQKPGNSGVLLRINGEPMGLPRCIEAQLKSGDAGAVYGFHGMRIAGAADRYFEKLGTPHAGDIRGVKKMEAAENTPGEWNTYEIDLDGGVLTIRVNGKKVNEATGCEILPGPIALQSEGGEIHFRKVILDPK